MTSVAHLTSIEVDKLLNMEQCSPVLISSPSTSVIYHKRASSVPLIELRHSEDEDSSSDSEHLSDYDNYAALNNESESTSLSSKGGMCSVTDTMESLRGIRGVSPMAPPGIRIKHITRSSNGTTRFPKLDECAHFHYENVELGPVKMGLCEEKHDVGKLTGAEKENEGICRWFCVQVVSNGRLWTVRRSYENFRMLDRQLHRCVYDRKYSLLPELPPVEQLKEDTEEHHRRTLTSYLDRFSDLAGSLISCGPVLNWLELDNRGNRLIVPDESAINTPAVAAAYVVRRYTAQATDEISFEVGDMISVIDMPPPEESTWWRGKKGFEVGFFPCECVEVIGDKIPHTLKVPKSPTKPVLRKHGKLIAFFRSFLLTRPSRRKLKQSGILKERVFGCDLGEHLLNTGREIPLVLKCCAEFIEEHGIVDGIYRLSGVNSNIQKLRLAFDEDRVPDLTDEAIVQDIHCVASLLKMYFRELPNPLLTYQLYDKFVNAVQSEEEVRLLRLRDIVQQLPPPHYRTLEYLMLHLAKVAGHGGRTGMTPKNVAIVWAPNLLRSKDVEGGGVGALHVVGVQAVLTEYLIRYADLLFNEKLPAFQSIGLDESSPRRARPKSLAISTPTKLLSLEEARSRALSANLPPAQQKYIDVGGGPENLPPKYHTVIDFPGGKRGSGKIKKSPSGWKSFFSRGWHSGSTREKERVRTQRKVSSGSLQHTSLTMQDVAVTELDISHSKKLRTVKSAESLVLLGGGSSSRNSGASEFSICGGNKLLYRQTSMEYVESDDDDESQESPCLPLTPQHMKHNRSSSHESYFEQEMDIPLEEHEMEEDNSIFNLVSETMSRMKEQSTNKAQCMEMNNDYFVYQTLCASESDTLPLSDVSDNGQDDLSHVPSDSSSSTQKSIRKQKLKDGESEVANAKVQKLSMMRFQQSAGSSLDGSGKDLGSSSDDDSSSTETYKWKDPEFIADCSTDSMPSQNLSSPTILDEVSCFIDSKNVVISLGSDRQGKPNNDESTLIETLQDENEDSKVVVERYGNEETVIVEVHATQESSDDETEKSYLESSLNAEKEDLSKSQITDVIIDCTKTDGVTVCDGKPNNDNADLKDIEILFVDEHGKTVDDTVDVNRNIGLINKSCNNSIDSEIIDSPPKETDNKSEWSNLSANDKNQSSSSEKADMLEVLKENNESPTNIPSLRPGSFASEVMEEYLLIKKSLDQAHFRECDGQNENSKDSCIANHKFDDSEERNSLSVSLCKIKESPTTASLSLEERYNSSNKDVSKSNLTKEWTENVTVEEIKKKTTKEFKISESEISPVSVMEPMPSSKNLENSSEEFHQTSFDGVQLRHTTNKVISTCQSEKKRNSEPEHPVIGSKHILSSTERKRMSEPVSSLPGEKNTVKGLMLKFEPIISKDNEICSERRSSTSSKPKISHPSLFTQLKVLKLQSLQSSSSVTTPTETVDPWSDPILDLEEEKELQSPVSDDRPSLIIHRDTTKVSEEQDSIVFSDENNKEIKSSKDNIAHETETSLQVKEEKCALELSAPSSDLMDTSSKSEENPEPEMIVSVSYSVEDSSASSVSLSRPEDEVVRRERINRIKEERRAQLREKLKSESFRMEAEEKEKVLNEFRLRKHSSGTKTTTTESSDEHAKNVLPRSQREKNSESESTQRQCSRIKKESIVDNSPSKNESPKYRTNMSVQKELPQKNIPERYSHRQQPIKQCLHRSVSDKPHSVQEKSQSKIDSPTKSCEKVTCKSPIKERLKKAASLDNSRQQSSVCEISPLSASSKVGKRTGEKSDKVPLSPNKSQTSNQDSKRVFSPSSRATNISQKRIRERAAMFEHPKDSQEPCRTGTPSGRFGRQRSSPSLTPSYVR